ncbi:hypothetical protein, partial [Nocardioides albidus]|uniref:hypothetical protein n=1 Tax=Nocardioides albidus TaxID=1517589 RepID=UPI0013051FAD
MVCRLIAALVASPVLLLGGCGDDRAWQPGPEGVETAGVVWASGSTVHLGGGRTIDVGRAFEEYVVARDGVYAVPTKGERGL